MIPELPVPVGALGVAWVVTFVASFAQGIVGFGFAVLAVPILALVDARLVPVPQLALTLTMTLVMLRSERAAVDWTGFGWVILGRLPGAALGMALVALTRPAVVNLALGGSVLVAVALLVRGRPIARTRGSLFGAGVVSGAMAYVAAIGGPPLALVYGDRGGPTLRATLAAVFAIGSAITLVARGLAGAVHVADFIVAAWMLPALLLGLHVSAKVRGKVSAARLKQGVLLMSALSAVGVIVRAVAQAP